MLESTEETKGSVAIEATGYTAHSPDGWRLLVEAEVDTIVRELRKNSVWAEAAERDGLGALWVGGSCWPGTVSTGAGAEASNIRREFASRRTLGRAGESIGMASFSDKGDEALDDDYAMGRLIMLESFLALREAINGVSDVRELNINIVLEPYLLVIRDAETTGPITRCALVSIQRFIENEIVDLSRPEAVPALLEVTRAVTHCRFEATDAASDEAVLMQILNVLRALVLGRGGERLNDVTICEIMETVLSMSCQMRLSEMLRKSAEATLFSLVTFVFGKLEDINDSQDEDDDEGSEASMVMPSPSNMLVNTARGAKNNGEAAGFGIAATRELYRVLVALTDPRDLQYTDSMRLLALNTLHAALQRAGNAMEAVGALRELTLGDLSRNLLLVLQRDHVSLISAAQRVLFLIFASHKRDTKGQLELYLCQTLGRLMAAPVIERQGSRAAIGTRAGSSAGSGPPTPVTGAGESTFGDGTLDITAIERPLTHSEEVGLYHAASLRRGVRGRPALQEVRRQLLEGLHHLLTGDEALLTDLWVNFDCDMQRGNMFDFFTSFMTQRAIPWRVSTGEDEAFMDILLFHLVRVASRAGVEAPSGRWAELLGMRSVGDRNKAAMPADASQSSPCGSLHLPVLLDRKTHKDAMMQAAKLFNEKPKDGVAFLQRTGTLGQAAGEATQHLAQFLRETPTLNKRLVGEFLAKPSNLEVLQAYVSQFDYSGKRLDEALRALLGAFRLPGESQQIERIMEAFATAYAASGNPDIATKDAAFILSYAVVMLNTDQHSPQVRSRMQLSDFARNLKGVNDGADFREGFLADVFAAIRDAEIVFPEEHEGAAGFEYAWRGVSAAGSWATTRLRTSTYDRALLEATWPRLLRALERTVAQAPTDRVLRRALTGLHALSGAAAAYDIYSCVDATLHALATLTGLGSLNLHAQPQQVYVRRRGRYMVLSADDAAASVAQAGAQALEEASVLVSQAALDFGSDYRAQIAFVALAELVTRFCYAVGASGWEDVLCVVSDAVDIDVLPVRAVLAGTWVPRAATLRAMVAAATQSPATQKQESSGLLSAFSSLWGSGGSGADSPRGSRPETPLWRAAPDQLAATVTRGHQAASVSAIMELADLPRRIQDDTVLAGFVAALARRLPQSPKSASDNYLPAPVVFLELAFALFKSCPLRAPSLWAALEQPMQRIFECAEELNPYVLERAVHALLAATTAVLKAAGGQDSSLTETLDRMTRCLGLLRDVSDATLDSIAVVLAAGIRHLVSADVRLLISTLASWDVLRQLLQRLAHTQSAEASGDAMAVLPAIVELIRSGSVDRRVYFSDTLDILTSFVPGDRALFADADDSRVRAGSLIAMLFDMQAAAKAEAALSPSGCSAVGSPNIGASSIGTQHQRSHQRTLTEPSVTSAISRLGITPRSSPVSMWAAAMNSLASYTCSANRETRQLACSHVQRAITTDLSSIAWVTASFHRVVFPLMDALLRADMLADSSMEDTHARCISMLTSFFLHNAAALQSPELAVDDGPKDQAPPLDQIWLRLIGVLSSYIYTSKLAREKRSAPLSPSSVSTEQKDDKPQGHLGVLGEMAEESTKNCILVLDTMGIFGNAGHDKGDSALWRKTWELLDKASPLIRRRILPAPADSSPAEGNPDAEETATAENAANVPEIPRDPTTDSADSAVTDAVLAAAASTAASELVISSEPSASQPETPTVAIVAEGEEAGADDSHSVSEKQPEPSVSDDVQNNAAGVLTSPAEVDSSNKDHHADQHHSDVKKKKKNRVNIITVS
ncbi:GDP/GTP exchange factor for ARF [Coemansia sp. RSA 1722]|nr:GDP/GTP exchange factor for ARF [Coemansia sp. RSA 485]KAJ2604327.1 GDP/GTP exchange factor for ARF [Coemansia sp. RSA 1722]